MLSAEAPPVADASEAVEDTGDGDRKLHVFRPVRVRKAADEVVAVLVDAIQGGIYSVGDLLPRERDLALTLEVSRATLREAMAMMIQAGAVTVRRGPGGGNIVASRSGLAALLTRLHGRPEADLRSILEVRRSLEFQAALLATERATPEDCEQLRAMVERLERLVDDDQEFLANSIQFLLQIAEISRNRVLLGFITETLNRFLQVRGHYPVGHVDFVRSIEVHWAIQLAIERRDRVAVIAATDERLGSTEEYLIGERLPFPSVSS